MTILNSWKCGLLMLAVLVLRGTVESKINPGQGVHHWYNWQKDVFCAANGVFLPSNEAALQDWMIQKHKIQALIKVVGNGHGFGNLTTCVSVQDTSRESWILKLDNFLDISVDSTAKLATFGAGWDLDDVVKYLAENYQLTVFNTGTERVQNFVGAFTTGTHGTGVERSIMAEHVVSMKLLMANGSFLTIDKDHYFGARVSLGALGIITSVTIQLKTIDYYKRTDKALVSTNLTAFYLEVEEYARTYPQFQLKDLEFTYNWDTLTWEPAPLARITYWELIDPLLVNDAVVQNCTTVILCCGTCYPNLCYDYEQNSIAAPIQGHECGPAFFAEFEHISPVKNITGSTALFQAYVAWFNTMNMTAIRDIYQSFDGTVGKIALRNPELRYVKADQIWMSEANNIGREEGLFVIVNVDLKLPFSNWIALDYYEQFLNTFLPQFGAQFNVRPHWGKQNKFDFTYTQMVYPAVDQFLALRAQTDPYCQFMNELLINALGLQKECGGIFDTASVAEVEVVSTSEQEF